MLFAADWAFKHNLLTKGNRDLPDGKAKSVVKIIKTLFKKAFKTVGILGLPFLIIPTLPLKEWRQAALLPTATSLLQLKVTEEVKENIKDKKQKTKYYRNRTAKKLPEIEIGQEVRIAPQKQDQP